MANLLRHGLGRIAVTIGLAALGAALLPAGLPLAAVASARPASFSAAPVRLGQRPGPMATDDPSRTSGSAVRVISRPQQGGERGEAGALVYQLGGDPARPGHLVGRTNSQGHLPADSLVDPGTMLVAVLPVSQTERLTYAFTNAAPTPAGLEAAEFTDSRGVRTLPVSSANPLLLLNLTISLEWEVTGDRAYLNQLKANLVRSSELLFDWSDGQVALGNVRIASARRFWETADVRVYATNNLRPHATQGGSVPAPTTVGYTVNEQPTSVTYEPGQVRIGATWSGDGSRAAGSHEDWARVLAHEIGHYALFLEETSLGRESDLLVMIDGCLSPMSDPYVESASEFRPTSAWSGRCLDTLQHRTTGLAEWALIKRRYDRPDITPGWDFTLNEPASLNANPGPATLPLQITTFEELLFSGEGAPVETTASYRLLTPGEERYEPSAAARAFLFKQGRRGAGGPFDLVDLGVPAGGQVLARGIAPDDRLCVFDPERGLAGCQLEPGGLRLRSLPGWRPELRVTPVAGVGPTGASMMTLLVEVPAASVAPPGATLPISLSARLFPRTLAASEHPASGVPFAPLTLEGSGPGAVYRGAFSSMAAVVEEGAIQLWVADDSGRETVSDFALGGQPGPLKQPPKRSRQRVPAVSPDGQATLFTQAISFAIGDFYTLQTVGSPPAPPAWATMVSQGYRLSASNPALLAGPDKTPALSLGYAERAVPPGLAGSLQVIFHDGTSWRELPTRLSPGRNEAVVTVQPTPGIYALAASLRLRLNRTGWNLVFAYPGATQTLPAALEGAGADYRMVYGFDEGDALDPWKLFAPGLPAQWRPVVNDLPALRTAQSYWIYATGPLTVPIRIPDDATRLQSLAAGNVLDQPPATLYGVVPGFPAGARITVTARVGKAECGKTTTAAHTIDGRPQAAFSLKVVSAGPAAPQCGRLGDFVTIELRRGNTLIDKSEITWDNTRVRQVQFGVGGGSGLLFLPQVSLRGRGSVTATSDLVVTAIEVVPASPLAGRPAEVRVTIANRGAQAVTRSFWVDLYVDPAAPPAPGQTWPDLGEFGVSWRVVGLSPGERKVLSSLRPGDPLNPGQSYSNFRGFGSARTYTLYARVDSFAVDDLPEGSVDETNEANNRLGPVTVQVRAP